MSDAAVIALYLSIGLACGLLFAIISNRYDKKEFGEWRNPATPLISLLLTIGWPLGVPILGLMFLFIII